MSHESTSLRYPIHLLPDCENTIDTLGHVPVSKLEPQASQTTYHWPQVGRRPPWPWCVCLHVAFTDGAVYALPAWQMVRILESASKKKSGSISEIFWRVGVVIGFFYFLMKWLKNMSIHDI